MKRDGNLALALVLGAVIVVGIAAYLVIHPIEAPSNSVRVNVVEDQSCLQCPPTNPVVNSLNNNDVPVSEWNIYDYNSTQGRSLIEKYKVERVPAIIISSNVMDYEFPQQIFAGVNLSEVAGSYVFYLNPPFRNLTGDKIAGLVDMYFITDATCTQCYNATIHAEVLQQDFKVAIGSALQFDLVSPFAQEFINRYNITAVPTYILTADAKYYNRLTQAWPGVGTIESNGYYVFRAVDKAGIYRNLTSGKIITPVNTT